MSDINRTAGDTRRVIVRLTHNSKAVPLVGWTDFKMLVDPSEASESLDTRVMLADGVTVDADAGRVGEAVGRSRHGLEPRQRSVA